MASTSCVLISPLSRARRICGNRRRSAKKCQPSTSGVLSWRVAAETVVVESEMRADDGMLSREPGARPLPIVGCALAVAEILHHDPVVCYLEHFGYAQRIGIAQRRESARFGTKEIGGGGMPRLHDRAAAIGQRDVLQSVEGRTTQGEYAHVEGT